MLTGLNSNTATNLQLGAGLISKTKYVKGTIIDDTWKKANVLTSTNGGITIAIVPEFFTPSIDGNFDNVMGTGKIITRWTVTATTTATEAQNEMLMTALGIADVDSNGIITGRHAISKDDYKDIYILAERGDGSIVQVTLKNAMNTSGLSLSTANNGNGGIALTISANYDVKDLDTPPFEIETIVPSGE